MTTRRWSAILHGLNLIRRRDERLSLTHCIIYLYVAENEGLTLSELAAVANLRLATASRAARGLTAADGADALAPYAGLLEVRTNPSNSNGRVVFLSDEGRRLAHALDRVIVRAAPIRIGVGDALAAASN